MAKQNLAIEILISAKDGVSAAFDRVGKAVAKMGAAVAAAGVAFATWAGVKFLGESVTAAEELDVQMRKLQGAIEATGGAAGLTADEIAAMADRLDESMQASDDQFRAAAAQLLTFKSVGRDVFETLLGLSADLSANGFGSIESAAVMLGKALEDPQRGMTALTRVGVSFTDQQRRVIEAMVRAGDAAGAQAQILEAVKGQVDGVAAAMAGGLTGAQDLVSKRFNDLREQIGTALLPVLESLNNRLADLYGRLRDSGAVSRLGEAIAAMAKGAADAVEDLLNRADFAGLTQRINEFAASTKETLTAWAETVAQASDVAARSIQGVIGVWDAFRGAWERIGAGISGLLSRAAGGVASLMEVLASVGAVSEQTAAKWRIAQETMADATGEFIAKSNEHLGAAAVAFDKAFSGIADGTNRAEQSLKRLEPQIGLTAAQLDALGESATYAADGQARVTEMAKASTSASTEDARAKAEQVQGMLDLANAQALEVRAAQDALRLAEQEGSLRIQRLRNMRDEAAARGELSRAQDLSLRLAREEASVAGAVAQAARDRATAADVYAKTLRAQAEAKHDDSAETIEQIRLAAVAAKSLALEAQMAEEAARSSRSLALAKQAAKDAADALADALSGGAEATDDMSASAEGAAVSLAEVLSRAISNAIDNLGTYSTAARDAAVAIREGWFGSFVEMAQTIGSMDAASLVAGDSITVLRQDMAQLEAQAAATNARLAYFSDAIMSQDTMAGFTFSRGLAETLTTLAEFESRLAEAAIQQKQLEIRTEQLGGAVDTLRQQYETGSLSLSDYADRLQGLQGRFSSLGDERLEGLRSALAAARQQMDLLTQSASDGLAAIQEELANLEGNTVEATRIANEQRRLDIQDKLNEAQKTGNREAESSYQKQLDLLDQISRIKIQEAKEAQAQAAQETSAATNAATGSNSAKTVHITLKSPDGSSTGVDVVAGQEDDLLEALRRSGLVAT